MYHDPHEYHWQEIPPLFMETTASTWKRRGRFYYDIEASIRVNFAASGLTVVRNKEDHHEVTLFVDYKEIKGRRLGINSFETIISGAFMLEHHEMGPLLEIRIQESSLPPSPAVPLYLVALERFQTNPYYFFLGDIIREHLDHVGDVDAILLRSLEQTIENHEPLDPDQIRFTEMGHSTVTEQRFYEPAAIRHTVQKFVRKDDTRIVPILVPLLQYPEKQVQVEAIRALQHFRVGKAVPFLEDLSRETKQLEVQREAQLAIESLK